MNNLIISQFEKLVFKNQEDLNKAKQENNTDNQKKESFRLKTNKRILGILKKYPEEITINNYKTLGELGGIGKGTITKIKQILEDGYIHDLKMFKQTDKKMDIVRDLEGVINIGSSKAEELYSLGVKSTSDLKRKVKSGKIEVNEKIKLGLKYHNNMQEKIPRNHIDEIEVFLQDRIKYLNNKDKLKSSIYILKVCGSYRRKKKTSGDIDVLITKKGTRENSKNLDKHLPRIIKILKKPWKGNDYNPFLVDDLTDISPTKYMGFAQFKKNKPLRIDIRFVSYDSFYTAVLYFTGSGEFNKIMRNIAKEKGYKLSEYGLFSLKTNEKIKVKSEKDVFSKLGMEYLEPEYR